MDPVHDLEPELDVQEQRRPVVDDEDAPPGVEVPLEADPGDVAEQVPAVVHDEDEYREE